MFIYYSIYYIIIYYIYIFIYTMISSTGMVLHTLLINQLHINKFKDIFSVSMASLQYWKQLTSLPTDILSFLCV